MSKIVVVGSAGMQITVPPHEPPSPGGCRTIGAIDFQVGGSAVTIAITLERLGVATAFTGVLGDDSTGHQVREKLLSESVDVTRLHLLPERTSPTKLIQTDADGEVSCLYHPGTNDGFVIPKGLDRVPCSVVHFCTPELLSGIWPRAIVEILRKLKVARRTVSLDTYASGHSRDDRARNVHEHQYLLEQVDIVFTTVEDAKQISGRAERESMINYFHERGVKIVAVKLDAEAALVSSKGGVQEVHVANPHEVDTSGSSESFTAGYLVGHVRSFDPLRCTRLGCTISGLCARAKGELAGTANRALLEQVTADFETTAAGHK